MEQSEGMDGQSPERRLRLANLGVVDQSPHLQRYAAQGFDVDGAPGGIVVPTGLRPEQVRDLAVHTIDQVREQGYDGAIIGGRADVVCYLRDALLAAGLPSFAADTALALDREGYFRPLPIGLIAIASPTGS